MADITERLRDLARDNGYRGIGEYWNACEEAADEIDRLRERWADAEARNVTLDTVQRERDELRARVAELEAQRDAAFEMSRCECDTEEACRNLAALHRRVVELEAAPAPAVDVDAISDDLIDEATVAFIGNDGGICIPKNYRDDMRRAIWAIFNKEE